MAKDTTGKDSPEGVNVFDRSSQEEKPAEYSRAVALKYEAEKDAAPRIVAKGSGSVAEQILALAFANGVKVREDAPLVEILSALEVDTLIPLEAYAAVAEILTYVYRANAQNVPQGQP